VADPSSCSELGGVLNLRNGPNTFVVLRSVWYAICTGHLVNYVKIILLPRFSGVVHISLERFGRRFSLFFLFNLLFLPTSVSSFVPELLYLLVVFSKNLNKMRSGINYCDVSHSSLVLKSRADNKEVGLVFVFPYVCVQRESSNVSDLGFKIFSCFNVEAHEQKSGF